MSVSQILHGAQKERHREWIALILGSAEEFNSHLDTKNFHLKNDITYKAATKAIL